MLTSYKTVSFEEESAFYMFEFWSKLTFLNFFWHNPAHILSLVHTSMIWRLLLRDNIQNDPDGSC